MKLRKDLNQGLGAHQVAMYVGILKAKDAEIAKRKEAIAGLEARSKQVDLVIATLLGATNASLANLEETDKKQAICRLRDLEK